MGPFNYPWFITSVGRIPRYTACYLAKILAPPSQSHTPIKISGRILPITVKLDDKATCQAYPRYQRDESGSQSHDLDCLDNNDTVLIMFLVLDTDSPYSGPAYYLPIAATLDTSAGQSDNFTLGVGIALVPTGDNAGEYRRIGYLSHRIRSKTPYDEFKFDTITIV